MNPDINTVELRNLRIEDYKELKSSMIDAHPEMIYPYWKESHIVNLLKIFPEGQLVILVDDIVVGSALSLIVNEELVDKKHDCNKITGNFTLSSHNAKEEVLYVFIGPKYGGLRLGRRLYDARKEICEQLNLKSIAFAERIPNYGKYAGEITPKEYIEKVKQKELRDSVLSFQLSNDFHVMRIMKNYLKGDKNSKEFAVLLERNKNSDDSKYGNDFNC